MKIVKNNVLPAGIGQLSSLLILLVSAFFLLRSDEPQAMYQPLAYTAAILGAVVCGSVAACRSEKSITSAFLPAILMATVTIIISFFPSNAEKSILQAILLPVLQFFMSVLATVSIQKMTTKSHSSSRRRSRR